MHFSLSDRWPYFLNTPSRMRRLVCAASFVLLVSATGASLSCADDATPSPYAATLRKHGIKPDAAELGKCLRLLLPNEQQRREARQLVEQLGSNRFAARQSATKRLMALPTPPIEALRIAAQSSDPEVRLRARKILALATPGRSVLMLAVFKTIERERVTGLTAELLHAVPLCEERYQRFELRSAVRAATRCSLLLQLVKREPSPAGASDCGEFSNELLNLCESSTHRCR